MRSSPTRIPSSLLSRGLVALWLACLGQAACAGVFLDGGRPTPAARQATEVLADAGAEGLVPEDYDAETLALAVASAAQGPALADPQAEQLDAALTTALHRYLADLHTGRIDPRPIRAEFTALPARDFDPAAYLKAALAAPHFADALRAAAPRVPLYASLRALLAHYRTLADHPAWATPLPPLPGKRKLEPGQPWAGLPQLTQRLVALGDLPEGTQPTPTYDTALQEGVKAFQQRHALAHLRLRPAAPCCRLAKAAAVDDIDAQSEVIQRDSHKENP